MLLVDDEPRILFFLKSRLKASGYEVLTAGNGLEAMEQFNTQGADFIVLDLVMPQMDGFETLKKIRALSSVPVIILSAKEASVDKVRALNLGADDYLAKPFSPDELVARIEAVRRRMATAEERKGFEFIRLGNTALDFNKHLVTVDEKEVKMTRIEWLLISQLARNAGKIMLYEELITRVWGPEYRDDLQILRTWMCRLRNKIGQGHGRPSLVRTIPRTGYIIDQPIT